MAVLTTTVEGIVAKFSSKNRENAAKIFKRNELKNDDINICQENIVQKTCQEI